jgi:hypothetical protein
MRLISGLSAAYRIGCSTPSRKLPRIATSPWSAWIQGFFIARLVD